MKPKAVVERLKEFSRCHWRSLEDRNDMDAETGRLIRGNHFAFLIAVAFNRGMRGQKTWQIPVEIDRKGFLDPGKLLAMASKGETKLIELLDGLAVRPRYGAEQGAKTLSDAAKLICKRFGGDAGAIWKDPAEVWKDASPAEVKKTLQEEIHGIGPGIASMATRILRDDFGCFKGQEQQIDVKPDVHLVRVFWRLGITDDDSPSEAIRKAKDLNPEFPGELDWPAWKIGQRWCRPTEPDCAPCPLTGVCEKRDVPPVRGRRRPGRPGPRRPGRGPAGAAMSDRTMTVKEKRVLVEKLVEKLGEMRRAARWSEAEGDVGLTAMTTLFGLIFHKEIGSLSKEIADLYEKKRRKDPAKWPGKGNRSAILTGRRMAKFADPHDRHCQRWKPSPP